MIFKCPRLYTKVLQHFYNDFLGVYDKKDHAVCSIPELHCPSFDGIHGECGKHNVNIEIKEFVNKYIPKSQHNKFLYLILKLVINK
jgi:hypothetical protein